jgi:hypothetical protein
MNLSARFFISVITSLTLRRSAVLERFENSPDHEGEALETQLVIVAFFAVAIPTSSVD